MTNQQSNVLLMSIKYAYVFILHISDTYYVLRDIRTFCAKMPSNNFSDLLSQVTMSRVACSRGRGLFSEYTAVDTREHV